MASVHKLRDLDYAAMAMLAIYPVALRGSLEQSNHVFGFVALMVCTACIWAGLSGKISLSLWRRLGVALGLIALSYLYGFFLGSQLLLAVYIVCFLLFSVKDSHWGRCLRTLSGIASAAVVFTTLPHLIGIPLAVLALVVFVGGLLSVWSGMNLDQAIMWFARRSLRKETFFLILFLAGIAAIGLRQAQVYSENQFGVSGLSAGVSPGGMKQLWLSNALAMRVKFDRPPPIDPSQAYIRAVALDQMSGFDWSVGSSRILSNLSAVEVDYETRVSLSPRHAQFTPVVDFGLVVMEDDQTGMRYAPRDNGVFSIGSHGFSWKHYKTKNRIKPVHSISEGEVDRLMEVDRKSTQSLRVLAETIAKSSKDVRGFIVGLSQFYTKNGFTYNLHLNDNANTPAEFLLRSKQGFCEHYAAASATLARLAGIPARVVTGFLGGHWQPSNLTLYVRDLDAHAWDEFWDNDTKSWVRFDAVSLLAPERMMNGGANYLRAAGFDIPEDEDLNSELAWSDYAIALNDFLMNFNAGFSAKASEAFVEYGEEFALIGALGLTISYIILVRRRRRRNSKNPELRLVKKLAQVTKRRTLQKRAGEPVFDWLARCAKEYSPASEFFLKFASAHMRYCHSGKRSDADLKLMGDCVVQIEKLMKSN